MPPSQLPYLRALSYRFASPEAAQAEIAHLRSIGTLPRGTVHVVSDVHGEFRKLEHIVRNGSGSLRPLVERTLAAETTEAERATLLALIYYPRETFTRVTAGLKPPDRDALAVTSLLRIVALIRAQACRYTLRHADRVFSPALRELFSELLFAGALGRDAAFVRGLIDPFLAGDGALELIRAAAHALRSFAVYELIVAGDLGDRGPRLDRVIETLRNQRNVSLTWGNHDAEWMGACLGQEALIATVLRISLRYGRIAQLEEGYGIPVEPLEQLARAAYGDDPAGRFQCKGDDLREPLLLARMQKAAAILQFKLEAATARRNPSFQMDHRDLLAKIDPIAGTVMIDGRAHPLLDRALPTVDWADPSRLSDAEAECIARLRQAFTASPALWRDMRFVADRGAMFAARDEHLIFHGCVPCDASGRFAEFAVDGAPRSGKALFDAFDRVVRRAFRDRSESDVDALYYLWAGARSPLFGKDKMATFEGYFIGDKGAHHESKDPYFKLLHEPDFCRSVAREFGIDHERMLIVNGHVPVKVEQGESPIKRSGLAVTIDGAFSEAYGDHGYTLIIEAERTYLARHHHFESIEAAVTRGDDIVPQIEPLRTHDVAVRVGDTLRGRELQEEIAALLALVAAYEARELAPPST
jgi:fructose-1,6-bisphosphatase-3